MGCRTGCDGRRAKRRTSSGGDGTALSLQCPLVGLVAAYAPFRHGRDFALRFGADEVTAMSWPLLVDGLLTMATVELWTTGGWAPRPGAVDSLGIVLVRRWNAPKAAHRPVQSSIGSQGPVELTGWWARSPSVFE